jgi:short-subunit dehydrogenase
MRPLSTHAPEARTALITGASGGIGLDLARLFAADGYRLVLVARNEQKLGAVAAELRARHGIDALVLPIDLSDTAAPEEIARLLEDRNIPVDVLVNNAGFGSHGPFVQAELAEQLNMIQVNVAALTHLTHLFLPGMIERKWGRVLNVASTASFEPGPWMAVYFATKAYVLSFSEAIATELAGTGVAVTALCPGPTATGFYDRAGIVQTPIIHANTMDSAMVARMGYRAMNQGRAVVIPGLKNKLLTTAVRFTPRAMVRMIMNKLNGTRGPQR